MNKCKFYFCILLFIALFIFTFFGISQINDRVDTLMTDMKIYEKPYIIIDAGHGEFDGGAENKSLNITEKDLNLDIAKKLKNLLMMTGYDVKMTREDDTSTCDDGLNTIRDKKKSDIHNRLKLMTAKEDSMNISIHMNKFDEEYVHGAQVFYAPNKKNSDVLADFIQKSFAENLQTDNKRKTKKADKSIYILYYNKVNPCVMVECGFISNNKEGKLLKTSEYQNKLAITLLKGINDFNSREETENAT